MSATLNINFKESPELKLVDKLIETGGVEFDSAETHAVTDSVNVAIGNKNNEAPNAPTTVNAVEVSGIEDIRRALMLASTFANQLGEAIHRVIIRNR